MTAKRNLTAFFIIGILGTVSHFVYEWSSKAYLIGLFFPVNESTWEHLKLLFFPFLLYSAIEYFTLDFKPKNYLSATAVSVLLGMLSIVVMFYTYKGIIGKNIDFINILIYFLGVAVTLFVRQRLFKTQQLSSPFLKPVAISFLILMAILFMIFSFNPPTLGIFKDPLKETALTFLSRLFINK